MSLPVTTPLFSVVEDAVFTARVVVVTARAFFRRIVVEVVEVLVTVDVVIVAALACISSVCVAREEETTRVGVTTTPTRSRGVDRDRIGASIIHTASTPPTRWVDKGRPERGTRLES